MTILFLVIAVLVVAVLIWYISVNNSFKRARIKIDEAKSGIEVALTKRYDVLTKLFDVAKSYAGYEKDIMKDIVNLRREMTVPEMKDAENKMAHMSERINLTAEAYPELRSNTLFVELSNGIRDTEEHLQASRRLYNSNVARFNTMREVFPSSIVGKKYDKFDFFEADEYKKSDVDMKF